MSYEQLFADTSKKMTERQVEQQALEARLLEREAARLEEKRQTLFAHPFVAELFKGLEALKSLRASKLDYELVLQPDDRNLLFPQDISPKDMTVQEYNQRYGGERSLPYDYGDHRLRKFLKVSDSTPIILDAAQLKTNISILFREQESPLVILFGYNLDGHPVVYLPNSGYQSFGTLPAPERGMNFGIFSDRRRKEGLTEIDLKTATAENAREVVAYLFELAIKGKLIKPQDGLSDPTPLKRVGAVQLLAQATSGVQSERKKPWWNLFP